MDYLEKLKDPRWQKKRLEILERDGWKCKWCGEKEKTLHVHHLFYFKDTEPWEVPSGFLITLCEDCHSRKENDRSINQEILEGIGNLIKEIWSSGYSVKDLILVQEAIFHAKKRPGGALIDLAISPRYLEDYAIKDTTGNHGGT